MYSRCGDVDESVKVFAEMGERNLWTWTALINGLAVHGRGGEAVEVFDRMVASGLQPDDIAYTGVLVACSHSGLVDEGWRIFNSIWNVEEPLMEHYGCMVDLLGRAGLVKEAYDFVQKMPMKPNPVIWRTLLGACVNHNHIELAETVEERIQKVEPNHDGDYVLLSNAYCTAGRWAEKAGLMHAMEQKGISKQLGCSWINMDQERHEFVSGDTKHPQADQIREFLVTSVMKALRDEGYTPSVSSSMFDLEVEEKEESVVHHSEKLAVAFALLGSKDHGAIRIMKNLRICGDCHSFMKHVSKTFDKEVVVRDRNRFHHFKQGCCSCGDYW
uniref:DYW domain-containing protein n=1 Tax=Kalanchoe fedtschenkoi TaxID=63787 RepID=A0A7N0T3J6_KALFE